MYNIIDRSIQFKITYLIAKANAGATLTHFKFVAKIFYFNFYVR